MLPLENLGDGTAGDRNFQALARLVPDTGGVTTYVRFGALTLTWAAGVFSGLTTVNHGLGRLPVSIELTPNILLADPDVMVVNVTGTPTTTSFQVVAAFRGGVAPGAITRTIYWKAIG